MGTISTLVSFQPKRVEGLHLLPPGPNPWPEIPTPSRTSQRSSHRRSSPRRSAQVSKHSWQQQRAAPAVASKGSSFVPRLAMSSIVRDDEIDDVAVISNFTNGVAELSLSPPRWSFTR